jgi:hypothetical protein
MSADTPTRFTTIWEGTSVNHLHKTCRMRLKGYGTRAETRFRLSEKRTGPFESAGVSAQSGASRRSVHIVVVTW